MRNKFLALTIFLFIALATYGGELCSSGSIVKKTIDAITTKITFTVLSGTTQKSLVVNEPMSNRGRIMTALLNACFESQGKLQYINNTRTDWTWYPADVSYIRVYGITIPEHDRSHNWMDHKFRYIADSYFDKNNYYKWNSGAAPRVPMNWNDLRTALKAGSEVRNILESGGQYFNAFWKEMRFDNHGGKTGFDNVFMDGEGYTFCYDAPVTLWNPDNLSTVTIAEAAAEVMSRKACCTYANSIDWVTKGSSHWPKDQTAKFYLYDFYPATTRSGANSPDIGFIQTNFHVWDGDYAYGGCDSYYNSFSDIQTLKQILEFYDSGFDPAQGN
jgi:hypothetical protein